jgi:hypothetical protein
VCSSTLGLASFSSVFGYVLVVIFRFGFGFSIAFKFWFRFYFGLDLFLVSVLEWVRIQF